MLALPLCWVGFGPILLPVPFASPLWPLPHCPITYSPSPGFHPCLCALTTAPWQAGRDSQRWSLLPASHLALIQFCSCLGWRNSELASP